MASSQSHQAATFRLPSPTSSASTSTTTPDRRGRSSRRRGQVGGASSSSPSPDARYGGRRGGGAGGVVDSPDSEPDDLSLLDDAAPLPFPTALPREDFLRGLTLDGRGGVKGARVGGRRRKFSVVVDRGTRDKLGSGAKGAAHDEAGAEEEEDEVDDDFDPIAYLSSLPPRHQTLEDLRAELRQRSADISAELMELVNREYAAFLGLGDGLRGGEERVEDVRVGMLGFRRAVEEVRARVRARRKEVEALTAELAAVRVGIEKARRMAECEDRLVALERKLLVASLPGGKTGKPGEDDEDADGFSDGFSDEDEDGDTDAELDTGNRPAVAWLGGSPAKLSALAKELLAIRRLADSIDKQTPFVRKLEERVARCRNTILLDLGTALMEARKAPGGRGTERVLGYLAIYRTFGAESEAVKTLKGA